MMNRHAIMAITSGVLSLAIVHFAYWLNVKAGGALDAEFICNPYLDGCVSTSRAVRSGPGILWFKAVMLPVAVLMFLTWRALAAWMAGLSTEMPNARRWTLRLGVGGAVALVVYVIYLGTEGEVYSWLRRYGVVFFFGFTALAQLVAARFIWGIYPASAPRVAGWFVATVSLQWMIGVFSVFKNFMFLDPEHIDRLENITEWFMIFAMSLGFVLIGLLLRDRKPASPS